MQLIPDGVVFGLLVLTGGACALSVHATTKRQQRLAMTVLYLVAALAALAGACALAGLVPA